MRMRLIKYFHIDRYDVYAFGLIVFAITMRIILAAQNWPITNSDEGTMGLMARHIAFQGDHPVYLYGQSYMGSLEAFLGAGFFHFLAPSLFTLRLGVILLDVFFFMCMYLLSSLLFSKKMALLVLALLSVGSSTVLNRQIVATGGSSETLVFGAFAFLVSLWLALTYSRNMTPTRRWVRLAAYAGWGLAVGLGYWDDQVVLPIFLMAGLLLLVFCWRDVFSLAPVLLVVGIAIGLIPVIMHNLHVPPGQNSLTTLLNLFKGTDANSPHTLSQLILGIKNTFLVSVPIATGEPFCPVWEIPVLGVNGPQTLQCTLVRGSWSLGYVILWVLSVVLTIKVLLKLRSRSAIDGRPIEEREAIVRHVARLCLLGAALIAVAIYAVSSAPIAWPGIHARYLIIFLIVTPVIIWPLWSGASAMKLPVGGGTSERRVLSWGAKVTINRALLTLIGLLLLTGTVIAFTEVPTLQTTNQDQAGLIHSLMGIKATHIYTDFWTCDRIAFISQEKIICGVLDDNLAPTHNRYSPYYPTVKADPHAAYVYPLDSSQGMQIVHKSHILDGSYRYFVFDGYFVYQPG